jgi:four helix bundle protein
MLETFRTYQLAKSFYHACRLVRVPRHLRDQLDRAAASVCLNIAEGAGRATRADQRRFYSIALGSLRESQAILDLSDGELSPAIVETSDKLAAHLFRLVHPMQRS